MSGEMGSEVRWGAHWVMSDEYDENGDVIPELEEMPLPPDGILGVFNKLIVSACERLPPATRYEIRRMIPVTYGRGHGMAWVRTPEMDKSSEWGAQFPTEEPDRREGYSLVGEFVTP